jgi:hypothetical protein
MSHNVTGQAIETPFMYEKFEGRQADEPLAHLLENTIDSIETYGRENPWSFGLWMMGIGFVLGWKLKIW